MDQKCRYQEVRTLQISLSYADKGEDITRTTMSTSSTANTAKISKENLGITVEKKMKIVDGLANTAQGKTEKVMANYTKLSMEGVKRNQGVGVKIEEKR